MAEQAKQAPRTHTPADRALIACRSLRAIGVEPTAARVMRMVSPLTRSQAQAAVAASRAEAA